MTAPDFKDFLSQGNEIQALQAQIQNGKLAHALIISGEAGTGKRTLAHVIAASLLCTSDKERPCCECHSCFRVFSDEHPDLTIVEKGNPLSSDSKKGRATIPVDDIRELIRLNSAYPMEGGNRVNLILSAEDMTPQAQNALLKILEEPPDNTYFILTCSHPEQLLITVRSRCRFIRIKPWDEEKIVSLLEKEGVGESKARLAAGCCHGSIGYAKQLAANEAYWKLRDEIIESFFANTERSGILSISSRWKDSKSDAEILFETLEECVRLMIEYRIGKKDDEKMKVFPERWKSFIAGAEPERFLFLMDRISDARKQYTANVSIQAIVEKLLLSFMGEIRE